MTLASNGKKSSHHIQPKGGFKKNQHRLNSVLKYFQHSNKLELIGLMKNLTSIRIFINSFLLLTKTEN